VEPSFVELLSLFEKVELPFEIRLDDFEKNKTKAVTEIHQEKETQEKNNEYLCSSHKTNCTYQGWGLLPSCQ
jgi:hypothetical protein